MVALPAAAATASLLPEPRGPAPILPAAPLAVHPDDGRGGLGIGAIVIAVIVAAIVGAGVYKASQKLPASYQASSEFVVSIPAEGGLSDPVILAENDAASQYAQLASARPVLAAAAAKLKIPTADLSGKITGSTLAAENVVQVTASASTPENATAWAQATGTALVQYIQTVIQKGSGQQFVNSASSFLKPLNAQIASIQKRLLTDKKTQKAVDNAILNTLQGELGTEFSTLATDAAGSQTTLKVVGGGSNASQTAPKPKEYALIGFVVAFLIMLRLLYVTGFPGRLRRRS